MTLGVSLNTNRNYIDINSVNEVAKQIFTKAENKTFELSNADLSKFRRPELGVDLYNQKVDIDTARQIAIRNAGLDIQLNQNFVANVQYLNTMAAQDAGKVAKAVEGKIVAPVADAEKTEIKNIFELPSSVQVANSQDLDKDRRGSNPFSFFSMNKNQGKEQQEEKIANIFA